MQIAKAATTDVTTGRAPSAQPAVAVPERRLANEVRIGNQAMLRRLSLTTPHVQCKLQVGAVNDPLEAEADRVADQVMRMSDPELPAGNGPPALRRKCMACEEEEAKTVRTKPDGIGPVGGEAPPLVHQVLGSPGQPLDRTTRAFFESRFEADLSSIRIHTDKDAGRSAQAVGALAYAAGRDIVFAPGRYHPGTPEGQRLLAHELTHTMQQGAARLSRWADPEVGNQARLREMPSTIRRQDDPQTAQGPAPATPGTGSGQATPAAGSGQAVPTGGGGNSAPLIYGRLSLSINGPLGFSPWWLGSQQEPAVAIHSPLMSAEGTVLADTSVNLSEYEIGFVQALLTSAMTLYYAAKDGGPRQTMTISVKPLPIRDSAAGSKPWSKAKDVKALDAAYIVDTEDRPNNLAPWKTPDGKGSLTSGEGSDFFCTWFAAHHKPSDKMFYLGWGLWQVDWGKQLRCRRADRQEHRQRWPDGRDWRRAGSAHPHHRRSRCQRLHHHHLGDCAMRQPSTAGIFSRQ